MNLPTLLPLLIGVASGSPLFSPLASLLPMASLPPCGHEGMVSCTQVEVHLDTLGQEQVTVLGTELHLDEAWKEKDLELFLYSEMGGSQGFFSTRGGKLLASVTLVEGGSQTVHQVEPCSSSGDCHVWKELGEEPWGEEEHVQVDLHHDLLFSPERIEEFRRQGRENSEDVVEYSMIFYTSVEFEAETSDIPLFVDTAIADMNKAYEDSGIPLRVGVHCIRASTISENPAGSISEMLNRFNNYMSSSAELRNSADAAQLLITKFSTANCGVGFTYAVTAGSGKTLTVVMKSCAYGYHSSGHELGHNFGCQHDKAHGSNSHYDYGYGWFIGPAGFGYRTCMAYNDDGHKTRLNRFSNPELSYQGEATGVYGEADNARIIRDNRFLMAAIGDETESC